MTSITETYINHAQSSPEKIAIQTNNKQINYHTWHKMVCKTANWLDSLNLEHRTIGILLPNGIPFLQLFAGAATAGWTSVLFDLKWTETELQHRLTLAQPSILITTGEFFSKVQHLPVNSLIWEDVLSEVNNAASSRAIEIDGKTPFYMGFTSGTTGNPKAFIRAHDSWVASFDCSRYDFQLNEHDHVIVPGALIHSHFLYGAISTLFIGGTVYLLEKFSSSNSLALMESLPITAVYVVPTMVAAFLKDGSRIEKHIKFLSSGAKWEENSKQRIRQMFPSLSMYEFYGASELSFVTVLNDNDRKPGSVGKPCHNVQIQIRRSNMEEAKPNEPGKIFVKSNMLFIGYLQTEGTSGHQRIRPIHDENGWITVDDMGYLDEDGYLYISGREKNMILYGAINIFPEEIEKVIGLHPSVEEVAVIGIQDSYWGQIAAAVVKGNATIMDLKKLCKQHLSSYKIPRKWFFIEEMPHTTSGKISRPEVKELIENEVTSH
ncbi:AMP-binding protein [Neobacillus bataviensis]|uniref:AMP-binding protein n=1 Tax=Neobacillus bataviensis TaxID=220685 RepID=UPI001CBE0CD3|nr:AMP-binding protein [Neobacillus bataviensis]